MSDSIYPEAVENEDFYIVKPGDTLKGIAKEFLGAENLYPLLEQINDIQSHGIFPGMMLLLHPEGMEAERENNGSTAD